MGVFAQDVFLFAVVPAFFFIWIAGAGAQVLPPQTEPPEISHGEEIVLYVSTQGRDEWSGALSEPDAGGTDGPLATVRGARDRIRELKAESGGDLEAAVTVFLRGGTYEQREPLVFTAQDSGADCSRSGNEYPITYAAYPGEEPVISGAAAIEGWSPAGEKQQERAPFEGKLWRAEVPGLAEDAPWHFNQLFVNGRRRTRARIPNERNFFRTAGPSQRNGNRAFYFNEGDIRRWENLQDAIVVAYHSWITSLHHIHSLDTDANLVTFKEAAPWEFGRWERRQRYYIENVFEGLSEPGEWYLDRDAAALYYCPAEDEEMAGGVDVVAPVITGPLVEFRGDPEAGDYVEYLHFRGISFRHTNSELQHLRNSTQAELFQPALVLANGLRHSSFVGCEIAHSGGHGIWLAGGCSDNRIDRCHIHSLAGGGVYIGCREVHDVSPTRRNTVNNSFIHDGSYLFRGAHGVWIGRSSCNTVTHNEISNFDYTGVSVGWRWNFGPTTANHNRIEYNHIHHIGNGDGLSDMGAIYMLGVSPGTTIRNNHIHDVHHYQHVSHGSGIYPDQGTSDVLIENNVVYRVGTSPLFMHYGRDCRVRNNILALGGGGQLHRSREDRRCHYAAEGNIIYSDHPEMLSRIWEDHDWRLARNVYWSTEGEPEFMGMDFESWQEFGDDEGSIVADPLFADPHAGDFSLRPDSPAFELGFEPIDVERAGLYGDREWVTMPGRYPDRTIKNVDAPPRIPIHLDFEGDEAGRRPFEGQVVEGGGSVRVSGEEASVGSQSLKFTDAPDQELSYTPHIYYDEQSYSEERVHVSWDVLNCPDSPGDFRVELRPEGPSVSIGADGTVRAGRSYEKLEHDLGVIPAGEWVSFEIDLDMGADGPGESRLQYRVPGEEPVSMQWPCDVREISWLGIFTRESKREAVFYIDNLKMGTEEELARGPAGRPAPERIEEEDRERMGEGELVGHWTFEKSNLVVEDQSDYGNHGESFEARIVEGAFGSALLSDTSGRSRFTVSDDPTLHFGTSDFTIELWLCPTQLAIESSDRRRRVLGKINYPTTWWNLDIRSDGQPAFQMADEDGTDCRLLGDETLPKNEWTHLAIVVNRTEREGALYINGMLDKVSEIPQEFDGHLDVPGSDLNIGSSWQPFVGLVDEVRIYRRALSAEELAASYEAQKERRTCTEYDYVDDIITPICRICGF